MSGMIFKRIVLPESNLIYEVTKGVASGHSFTSVITTLCAYGTISTAISKIIPKEEIKYTFLQGAGDDWNGVMPDKYLEKVSKEINDNSGSTCDPLTDRSGNLTDANSEVKPTFLKKAYDFGLIAWNKLELFVNLSYPTSSKMNLLTRIMDYMVMGTSGPFDVKLNNILERLIILQIYKQYIYSNHYLYGKQTIAYDIYEEVLTILRNYPLNKEILDVLPKFSFNILNP